MLTGRVARRDWGGIARQGLELESHPANVVSSPLMAGFTVSGDLKFSLFALWPVQIDGGLI